MSIDVFISYSRVDHAMAGALAGALQAQSVRTWWDSQLIPGDDVDLSIQRILQTTRSVLAVLSPSSLSSEWVMWELGQARDAGLCVLPVLVAGAGTGDLPASVGARHAFVLPPDGGARSLAQAVAHVRAVLATLPPGHASLQDAQDPPPPPLLAGAAARDARRRLALAAAEAVREGPAPRPPVTRGPPPGPRTEATASAGLAASPGLFDLLERLDLALAFCSRRSGTLHLVGRGEGHKIVWHQHPVPGTMGLSWAGDWLRVSGREHLFGLQAQAVPPSAPGQPSHRLVLGEAQRTGPIELHDLAHDALGRPVFAHTRGSSVGRLADSGLVEHLWQPPFISSLANDDRCHLNGLALRAGQPAYVTAAACTDEPGGWRLQRATGGVVIDVQASEVVAHGLSMPHSPRWVDGRLWLLNAGRGELGFLDGLDSAHARFVPVASFPGFARGLAIQGQHAFVGVSHPRQDDFAGLPLQHLLPRAGTAPWCGIRVIDLGSGECVAWLRLPPGTGEIHDLALLPQVRSAQVTEPRDDANRRQSASTGNASTAAGRAMARPRGQCTQGVA